MSDDVWTAHFTGLKSPAEQAIDDAVAPFAGKVMREFGLCG